jgi:hypothetical protein
MNDIYLLNKILIIIKEKQGYPDVDNWNNSIYSDLSDALYKKTHVLLSRNTLKYLVDKVIENNASYSPQQITKQALCQFIDYEGWDEFRSKHINEIPPKAVEKAQPIQSKKRQLLFSLLPGAKFIFAFTAVLLLVFLAFIFYPEEKVTIKEFSFLVSDSTGVAPHTLSINYDFSNYKNDSINIDFDSFSATGKYELKRLYRAKGIEKFCFYYPGMYRCAVYANQHIIKRFDAFIESDSWNAYVWNATTPYADMPNLVKASKKEQMRYIPFDNFISKPFWGKGEMNVSKSQALAVPGITKNYNTTFFLYRRFNVSGDDFKFKVSFLNPFYGEDSFCYSAFFEIICTNGKHYYQIMNHGCHLYAKYGFSEVTKNGINSTIDGFEHDFSRQRTLECINKSKQINLLMDGNTFHKNTYNKPVGDIIGIRMTFKGAPVINLIELSDNKGNIVYFDDFTNP